MWDQVEQSLSRSMTQMLSRVAGLLPGIAALIVALLVSALLAWVLTAILRRSLNSIDFDRRVSRWGFPTLAEWSPSRSPTRLVTASKISIAPSSKTMNSLSRRNSVAGLSIEVSRSGRIIARALRPSKPMATVGLDAILCGSGH